MQKQVFETSEERSILDDIREGMHVHDRDDKKIGTVDHVFLGEGGERTQARGEGPATVHNPEPANEFADVLIRTLGQVELPEVVRSRLLQHGYLHIKAGLLGTDAFIMPSQIAAISGDHVVLNVKGDELIKPS